MAIIDSYSQNETSRTLKRCILQLSLVQGFGIFGVRSLMVCHGDVFVTDNPLRTCWKSIMITTYCTDSRKSLKPLKFSRQILVSQEIYRCMTSLKPLCGWSHGLKSQPKVKGQMWQMIEYMNTLGRIRDTCVFLYVCLLFCRGNVKVFVFFSPFLTDSSQTEKYNILKQSLIYTQNIYVVSWFFYVFSKYMFFSKGCLASKATCARFGCGSRQEPHATLDPGGTASGVRANHWIVERYEGAKSSLVEKIWHIRSVWWNLDIMFLHTLLLYSYWFIINQFFAMTSCSCCLHLSRWRIWRPTA